MQNEIRREIEIKGSKEKIYDAIANAEKVTKWFPETLEGEYEVGQQPIFGFGEHGRNQVLVVAANPHDYFAFRWVPGAAHFLGDIKKVKSTLVEFRIVEVNKSSCMVILTESGFADLSADVREKSFQQNSGGWDFMLGRLQKYFS